MLRFRKSTASSAVIADARPIVPTALPVPLEAALFQRHFDALLAGVAGDGGVDSYLSALAAKRQAVVDARERAARDSTALKAVEALLALVFTARRRLYPALVHLGDVRVGAMMTGLWFGASTPAARLQQFVDAMPGAASTSRDSVRAAAALRRAAWDFAAEMLHYGDAEGYPLMSRWVWDQATQSGALREFVRGGDAMREVPFSNDPGIYEGARQWLAAQLAAQGIYRDEAQWINLVLAQAYLGYFRSMTEGSLGGDFGRGVPPQEQLKRLLGIDAAPGTRPDRVKKPQAVTQAGAH